MLEMDFEVTRFNAIEQQIRPWYVNDLEVLSLLKETHRELFVLPQQKNLAFSDTELEILPCKGRYLLSPKVEARIIQEIKPFFGGKTLVIGSDLGYIPAILTKLGQQVTILEENADLLDLAKENLANNNVSIHVMIQSFFAKISQTFNTIICTASVEFIPQVWLDALEKNGALIAFVGNLPALDAQIITKSQNESSINNSNTKNLFETWVNRFPQSPKKNSFSF